MAKRTDDKRKNAGNTRGKPFEKGNSGRPTGSRNKITLAVEALLDGEAAALTQKAIDKAKEGDMQALKLCLDRICPVRKGRIVEFDLPDKMDLSSLAATTELLIRIVAAGALTSEEAQAVAGLMETHRRAVETVNLEERIERLEEGMKR